MNRRERVNDYIKNHWKNTVRTETSKDDEIPLPYPKTVPCENQRFTYFFYWDTYFANLGLLYDMPKQALNNLRNMKCLVDRFGFIPNANLHCMLNRSQPPLFCSAVYDYYRMYPSADTVCEFFGSMRREYEFWMKSRNTDCGLNQYSSSATKEEIERFVDEVALRGILKKNDCDAYEKSKNLFAEAESGWDFSPRFDGRALDFVQVDLNSILYRNEIIISEFAKILNDSELSESFARKADRRKNAMYRYMKDCDGILRDYDFINKKQSGIISVASLLPFGAGLIDDRGVCEKILGVLECEKGIAACEKSEGSMFQWDYPNMWPPLVYFSVKALQNSASDDSARRIADKYMNTVAENFDAGGCLYEKYSSVTGKYSNQEYESPKMLGWTAGVFRNLYECFYH